MLAPNNFGGSSREVTFLLKIETDPRARAELEKLKKEIEDVQKMATARVNWTGGGYVPNNTPAGRGSVGGGLRGGSNVDPVQQIKEINKLQMEGLAAFRQARMAALSFTGEEQKKRLREVAALEKQLISEVAAWKKQVNDRAQANIMRGGWSNLSSIGSAAYRDGSFGRYIAQGMTSAAGNTIPRINYMDMSRLNSAGMAGYSKVDYSSMMIRGMSESGAEASAAQDTTLAGRIQFLKRMHDQRDREEKSDRRGLAKSSSQFFSDELSQWHRDEAIAKRQETLADRLEKKRERELKKALAGTVELARGVVLLGAASAESAEQALKMVAAFEGAVSISHGVKDVAQYLGAGKMAGPIGAGVGLTLGVGGAIVNSFIEQRQRRREIAEARRTADIEEMGSTSNYNFSIKRANIAYESNLYNNAIHGYAPRYGAGQAGSARLDIRDAQDRLREIREQRGVSDLLFIQNRANPQTLTSYRNAAQLAYNSRVGTRNYEGRNQAIEFERDSGNITAIKEYSEALKTQAQIQQNKISLIRQERDTLADIIQKQRSLVEIQRTTAGGFLAEAGGAFQKRFDLIGGFGNLRAGEQGRLRRAMNRADQGEELRRKERLLLLGLNDDHYAAIARTQSFRAGEKQLKGAGLGAAEKEREQIADRLARQIEEDAKANIAKLKNEEQNFSETVKILSDLIEETAESIRGINRNAAAIEKARAMLESQNKLNATMSGRDAQAGFGS